MELILVLSGFVIGVSLMLIINCICIVGHLRIDTSDPSKDYYLMDISKDLSKLSKKKKIILKVDNRYKKTQ